MGVRDIPHSRRIHMVAPCPHCGLSCLVSNLALHIAYYHGQAAVTAYLDSLRP